MATGSTGQSKYVISAPAELSIGPLVLIGKEREHYLSLERLYAFSLGEAPGTAEIVHGVSKTVEDWNQMLGNRSSIVGICEKHLAGAGAGDRLAARTLYLFISPLFFYIHSLYELTRNAWRNGVIACGIFCERIVRNLLIGLDAKLQNGIYLTFNEKGFADRNGRVKKELEELGFPRAEDLFSLLKMVYSTRNVSGPHDVPPPEPLQARINVTFSLPIYLDYVSALDYLGTLASEEADDFVSFMTSAAHIQVALAFGYEADQRSAGELIKDSLYRVGFFNKDQSLRNIVGQLRDRGYTFSDPVVANALRKLSSGRTAILTRTKHEKVFLYRERFPPSEYFQSVI